MPIVYLDSNIYRQMGLHFVKNVDYQNLSKILESSGNEFGLLEIVYSELMDYYKNDIFDSILSDHEKLYKRYLANPYLDNIVIPETTAPMQKAVALVSSDLHDNKFFSPLIPVDQQLLLDFLLHNKRLAKKDNTRDFLIFYTLCELCKKHSEDYLVLISEDDIFKSNKVFKKILIREKIYNLKIYKSISGFLKDFGPKIEFITPEVILAKIESAIIEKELLNGIKDFPSYVSQFYYEKSDDEVPDIEKLEIKSIAVNDFYVIKDYKTEELKLNVTLKVGLNAIFKPEANKEELDKYLSTLTQGPYSFHLNTFDKEGRPIFDNNVLFIFEGKVDEKSGKVEQLAFIDFIPDYFIIEETE
ncbi:MAG: hypothetical protein IM474_20105 [Microcystis sp. M135S2]|uniref:hypothetical protein n=1 Tax=Microcystis sp. M135S2 TaxID=2771144 RepID=UPI0025864FB3|nr:hypothetical protein [Microcystis sp. M135S2]MCA2777456.1 hypothetical protein [Microcystis sp. M135S2]MCA6516777.1 hypothetical protein [Chitinophagaceae bacterium]